MRPQSQICCILQLNPQLEGVALSYVAIRDKNDAALLALPIHNLARLTQLVLNLFVGPSELKSMIFFCLLPSLQNLKIFIVYFCTGQVQIVINTYLSRPLEFRRSWDCGSASTLFRISKVEDILRNPMPRTRQTEDALRLNDKCCLFKRCPYVRYLKLPLLHYDLDAYTVSRIIATTCQKLRDLAFDASEYPGRSTSTTRSIRTMVFPP